MKYRILFAAAALVALGPVCAPAQSASGPGMPASEASKPTDEMLEVYGWFLGQQMELYSFGFNEAEIAAVSRGIVAAARGEEAAAELESVGPSLQEFLGSRPAEVQQRRLEEGKAEQEKFFAGLDENSGIQKTDSGLRYEVQAAGAGPKPTLGSTVVAHYTGSFVDGRVFDSSIKRGEPAEFELDGVIEGWQEGLQLIGKGGRIKLYVPGDLAYGDTGRMNIPPAKTLIFEVELIDVKAEQPQLAPLPPGMPPPEGDSFPPPTP